MIETGECGRLGILEIRIEAAVHERVELDALRRWRSLKDLVYVEAVFVEAWRTVKA